MSNAAGTEALACSVAAARLTSATLRLVATRAATRSPDMRAAPTMKRRLGPESIFSAVGDSPWLVDRRGACGGCLCRSGGAHKSSGALAACAERPLYIIECPAFGRIDSLPRPEIGKSSMPRQTKPARRCAPQQVDLFAAEPQTTTGMPACSGSHIAAVRMRDSQCEGTSRAAALQHTVRAHVSRERERHGVYLSNGSRSGCR
jgi:hypothetical protein